MGPGKGAIPGGSARPSTIGTIPPRILGFLIFWEASQVARIKASERSSCLPLMLGQRP